MYFPHILRSTGPVPCVVSLAAALAVFVSVPLRAAAPAVPPYRLGLNDVFIGGDGSTTDQQLAQFKEVGAASLRHIQPSDVQWGSVQTGSGIFTFTQADSVLASGYGFGFLPTFYGNSTQNYYVPPGTASTESWSAATYGAQTTTYLQTVVNRYKTATHYWEIGNEMNTKTTAPAGFTAAGYAEFLIFNRNAIRAADPSAQVVIAGLLGNYGYPIDNAYTWLRDVLAAGGGAGFDVFNFHDYKSWWTLPTHYDQYRAILDAAGLQSTPIWVSETAQASTISNSNINPAYASIDGQAADVWRRPCVLFGKGVQTVFWHSFWANSSDTSGFHDMGLVNTSTGIRKKSWHSMKLLNQKIEGFASATMVSMGVTNDDNVTGGSGVWVVRFDFSDGTKRWVAWSPNNQSTTLTGLTGIASAVVTTVVPASVSADGITATWTTSTRTVTSGSLALTLADAPVLIEAVASAPAVATQPVSQSVAAGGAVALSATASGTGPFTYQWQKNGVAIAGGTSATLALANVQPADTGLYAVTITNATGSTASDFAIVGVTTTNKVTGAGTEVGANIVHANGNSYDQILLQGAAAAVTADANQSTRISYIDLTNDIVQVEFSGAGTLSLVLDSASGPAAPVNYNQPTVSYMKGHAGIVIVGANETTNVSIFSVGTITAVNQALFKTDVTYDGLADIAYLAVLSTNGKFGGVRTANTSYFATKGLTGVDAPGVQFTGPVYVGDVNAFDAARPVLILGAAGGDTSITGGDLFQTNGQPVKVNGITQLKFVSGTTSHGAVLPAQTNKARLEQNGADVTAQIVVNPAP